jgi:hypothetical protein
MRTLAVLLILVGIAASQPHRWLSLVLHFIVHCLAS